MHNPLSPLGLLMCNVSVDKPTAVFLSVHSQLANGNEKVHGITAAFRDVCDYDLLENCSAETRGRFPRKFRGANFREIV